ncbi:DNA polymerase III subunit chi [Ramlibacter sp. PS4R-6]|uniref:DNA polymerase III subunit chi n=1 Tax=Ramlibacter sp. PS4R-6 TaxID=3133438 RepID=UPI00309A889D
MTSVEFRFNAPDKLGYACTMLRRAALQRAKVAVTAEPELLRELDRVLWTFEPLEFVPHCFSGAPAEVLEASPIVLCDSPRGAPHHDVLVNLGAEVPEGFERFERLIEVVTPDEADRQGARGRWQHYKSRGYEIQRKDLEAQEG